MVSRKVLDSMGISPPEPGEIWWRQMLRRSAIDSYRQQQRWKRDALGVTTDVAAWDQRPDVSETQALDTVEWHLLFDQVLDRPEACVVDQLYWQAATQRQTAASCVLSQTTVRRVHQQALRKLRRAFW